MTISQVEDGQETVHIFQGKKRNLHQTQPETSTEQDFGGMWHDHCAIWSLQRSWGVPWAKKSAVIHQSMVHGVVRWLMVDYFRRNPNQSWGFLSSKRSMASGSEVGVKGVGTTLIWYWITLLLPLIEKPKKLSDIKTEVQLPWKLEQKKPWKHLPAEVFTLCLWLSLP